MVKGYPIGNIDVDIEGYKAKEEAWAMMDEWKGTKAGKVHYYLDCNEDSVHLACPIDMVKGLKASFG